MQLSLRTRLEFDQDQYLRLLKVYIKILTYSVATLLAKLQ